MLKQIHVGIGVSVNTAIFRYFIVSTFFRSFKHLYTLELFLFSKAKLLLKKKRYLESLLNKTDNQLDNLQQMVETIEFTQIELQVVEGLKTGNECLEEMHKVLSGDEVLGV